MVATAMDALASFVYLTDHLPEWISQIRSLSTHTSQRHDEFVAEYARIVAQAKPRRHRSRSLRSLHTDKCEPSEPSRRSGSTTATTPELEINPLEPGNKYLFASIRRQPEPGSSVRSGASGPQRFRSKHMAVIYYDSFVQVQLEGMVKNIGAARNNLRKGRMSSSLKRGLQLPSITQHFDPSYDDASLAAIRRSLAPKNNLSPDSKPLNVSLRTEGGDAAFTQAEKDLERAQLLCETAAHQFLRDGNCSLELETAQIKLETVLGFARSTVESLKKEEEVQNAVIEAAARQEECPGDETSIITTISPHPKILPPFNEKMEIPPLAANVEASAIEVGDDSDGSSIMVNISKIRAARTTGVRA